MIGPLESSWSHRIICRLVEMRKSSASMMPTWLAPRNRSKDFLASASCPLDINQAGDSGQNKIITKQIIGMITVDPMAYLQDNTAPEKHKHPNPAFIYLSTSGLPKVFSWNWRQCFVINVSALCLKKGIRSKMIFLHIILCYPKPIEMLFQMWNKLHWKDRWLFSLPVDWFHYFFREKKHQFYYQFFSWKWK